MLVLEVHEGTHRRTIVVDQESVRIGRGHECEVPLPGDATVSRVHAVLRRADQGWEIADVGSRNGTFVNGRRLERPEPVAGNDRILVGQFLLVLRDGDDDAVETAPAAEAGLSRVQLDTGLSARELEVLRLVCAGRSDREIAEALVVSVKTVHSHLERIRDKSGARRRPELVRYAMAHGIA